MRHGASQLLRLLAERCDAAWAVLYRLRDPQFGDQDVDKGLECGSRTWGQIGALQS